MNPALVEVLITLLGKLIPAIGNNQGMVDTIIQALEQIVPVLVKEYQDLLPIVTNIIQALKGRDGITNDQWAALDALETQIDNEFDTAAQDEGL